MKWNHLAEEPCSLARAMAVVGDRWTLLILRDMLIGGKRNYRDFLNASEKIATNVLADRLKSMVEAGLITRADDPNHGAQAIYSPTAKAEALRPVLGAMATWALQYGPKRLTLPAAAQGTT